MNTISINLAHQFAADRQAQFEGVATRRRLRRLVRRNAADAATHHVARRAPELVLTSHNDSVTKDTRQKVA